MFLNFVLSRFPSFINFFLSEIDLGSTANYPLVFSQIHNTVPVWGEDDSLSSLLTFTHDFPQSAPRHWVDSGRRLVQEHDGRLPDERHRRAQLALVATAVCAARTICVLSQAFKKESS